jgi:phage protein|nr:MAG TPA: hypothetical protein [Caudoviricetes sp.]
MSIDIQLKKSGFPINVGGHELWFDLRAEKVKEYAELEQEVNKRLNEIQKEIMDKSIVDGDKVNFDNFDGAIELTKESTKLNYDLIFGEGTFDKLYNDFPDIQALTEAWIQVQACIEVKLEQLKEEREKESEQKVLDFKAKLAEKK